MSVRLLLAVVLAGALVAASLPAIEAAQRTRADSELSTAVDEIEIATSAMVRHSDPVPPHVPGATRRVRVEPPAQPDGAGLTIEPAPGSDSRNGSLLTVMIPGEPAEKTLLAPTIRPLGPEGSVRWKESVTVSEPIELIFTYRRADGTPVIEVTRGFK
ncbi:MAG: hypothetical protein ABEJ84_00895 [Halodesulfurarchaeum sp.]